MEIALDQIGKLKDVLALVPAQPGVPSSTFVGIRSMKSKEVIFSLTSLISAECRLPGDLSEGYWGIDRRILFPFLESALEPVKLSIEGEVLLVRSGKRKANLRIVVPNWTYDTIDTKKFHHYPLTEAFRQMLVHVRLCASDDPVLPEVNCVYIEFGKREYLFSTNDIVLCMAAGSHDVEVQDPYWAVPVHLIDALGGLKEVSEIFVHERVMGVSVEGGKVWGNAPEKAWTEFPKDRIKSLLVKVRKIPPLFSISASSLSEICQRFIKYLSYIPKNEWALKIEAISPSKARTESISSYATFSEEIDVKAKSKGMAEINLALIGPVLQMFKEEDIEVLVSKVENAICHVRMGQYELLISQRA